MSYNPVDMKNPTFTICHFVLGVSLLLLVGCKRDPTDRLVDSNLSGSVPQISGIFHIFDDELKTAGGLGFVPGGENQSIDLRDQSSPRGGLAQIRYAWNGGEVFNDGATPPGFQHDFAGFSLLVSQDFTTNVSAPARNLSAANYTQLIFSIRGSLSANTTVKVDGPDDGDSTTSTTSRTLSASEVGSGWREYAIAIPIGDFSSIKVFVTFTLQYAQPPRTTVAGNGGVIYVDNIRYAQ